MLRWLLRGFLLDRLLRGLLGDARTGRGYQPSRRTPARYSRRPHPAAGGMFGPAGGRRTPTARSSGRPRGRGGFFGPVPYYSTRTRRGTQVSVGGCCLPIPLGMLLSTSAVMLRRMTRRRPRP